MTEILCDWLNKDVELSVPIDPESFEKEFSNGYLIGEVLHKYELQDDFERFSKSTVSESKINNFTRVEPVLHLLGVPFDTNTARSIMTEEPGVVTRLMYQLFISLENKKKANLTGVAMETMRPAAPAKLQSMESIIYRQRLKQVTPRQTDLNLKELIDKFHQHQQKLEERALKGRIESAEAHRREHQQHRQRQLQRSKQLQVMQSEQMAKIQAAIVQIPKPPPNRTAAAIESRKLRRHEVEAASAMLSLDEFEEKLSRTLQPAGESTMQRPDSSSSSGQAAEAGDAAAAAAELTAATKTSMTEAEAMEYVKPASNDAYISKIRRRLAEDAEARAAREKRRRKVLVDCLRAHEQQEEQARESQLAGKLVRQSQMERRIAVQLLQARREKDILKRNRLQRECQYQQRREQEFVEAMDREKRLAEEARSQYEQQLELEQQLHEEAAEQRQMARYNKHFNVCLQVVADIADVACRVADYRQCDAGKLPKRKYRDLVALFVNSQPLYSQELQLPFRETAAAAAADQDTAAAIQEGDPASAEDQAVASDLRDPLLVSEEKEEVQDDSEFLEYRDMLGEWQPPEDCDVAEAPDPNPVIGWIVDRVHAIAYPPSPPPSAPELPPFPVKAAICGKLFSGKSSAIQRLVQNNRCISLRVSELADAAMQAFKEDEREPIPTPPPTPEPAAESAAAADAEAAAEASSSQLATADAQQQQQQAENSQSQLSDSAAADAKGSRPGSKKGGRKSSSGKASPARVKSRSSSRAGSADKSKTKSPRQDKDKNKTKSPRGASPKSPRGRKARSPDAKDSKSKSAQQDAETSAEQQQQLQDEAAAAAAAAESPKPGAADWEYLNLPIPDELAYALAPLWQGIENGYLCSAKSIFRRLRHIKDSAILYFYNTRQDFLQYLERPDNKQTYVTAFQQQFNEIPQEERFDEEVIADLHQRFEELRERLIDMTDKRKDQAEEKKQQIENSGWVEDRIGIITNLYIELLQAEMDRFQDSIRFMKDYYKSMDNPVPDYFRPEFIRLPIMQLPFNVEDSASRDGSGSRASSRHQSPVKAASPVAKKNKKEITDEAKELTDEEIEAMFQTKVPTVGQSPTIAEFKEALQSQVKAPKDKTAKKEKKTERMQTPAAPTDADAKIVFDAFWAAVSQITQFINQELSLKEVEEEAERQRLLEKEKEREKAVKEASKGGGKKGAAGGKKGKSRSPSPKKGAKGKAAAPAEKQQQEENSSATPDPMSEPLETEEEIQQRQQREKIREEYFFALDHEAKATQSRMQLCVAIANIVLQDMKQKKDEMNKDLIDWIGARLLHESELIDRVADVIRLAIESRQPINERLELSSTDFLINSEFKVIPELPPPSRPPPVEQLEADWFSMRSIHQLLKKFFSVAPDGLLAINEFVNVIMEIIQCSQELDALPAQWQECSSKELQELAESMSCDEEYVSWRSFLLGISQPWPWPSQQQLLDTLAKFKDLDQLQSGFVTKEQFNFIDLWFSTNSAPPTPTEPTQPKVINRLDAFKQNLFEIFANSDGRMQYEHLLFHCAASPSCYVGFLKALSVANDSHIPHLPIPGFEAVTAVDPQAEEVPEQCTDALVNIEALYKVLGYGRNITEDTTDFSDLVDTEVTQECLTKQMLGTIYHQLGSDDLEPLPFTKLVKHVSFVELLLQAQQYKQIQFREFLSQDARSSRAASVAAQN